LSSNDWIGRIVVNMQNWKTLTRKLILDEQPWLKVESHAVELPTGRIIPNWQWVITPDYVNVVAVTDDDAFICFRQVKYGIEGDTLAIVGGYINNDELPLAAAQRELREETGYEAANWQELGHYRVDPNRGMAMGHLFLARHAQKVALPIVDDLEEQQLLYLARSQIEEALITGEFKVMAWAAAIAMALRYL
jgi:ADP-ribose pyrophosphatase